MGETPSFAEMGVKPKEVETDTQRKKRVDTFFQLISRFKYDIENSNRDDTTRTDQDLIKARLMQRGVHKNWYSRQALWPEESESWVDGYAKASPELQLGFARRVDFEKDRRDLSNQDAIAEIVKLPERTETTTDQQQDHPPVYERVHTRTPGAGYRLDTRDHYWYWSPEANAKDTQEKEKN